MTEPGPLEDEDPRIGYLRVLRDQLRAQPDQEWTASDVADHLDEVIGNLDRLLEDDDTDPLLQGTVDAMLAANEEPWPNEQLVPFDRFAQAALDHIRPRLTLAVVDEIADVVQESPMRCPVHDIPDCSPMLNGCGLPRSIPASVASYIRSVKQSIEDDLNDNPPTPEHDDEEQSA